MRHGIAARVIVFLLVLAGLGGAAPALAQQATPTDGIRFGAFSIHPSLYTALRYSDNVYFVPTDYRPADERSIPQSIESDLIFNVVPAIFFNLAYPTVKASIGYRFYNDMYLGVDDPDNQHDKLNGSNHTAGALVDYKAPFGLLLGVSDNWTKMQAYEQTDEFVDYLRGDQIHNDGRAWLGWRTGAYESFYFKATYLNFIDQFDHFRDYNKMTQIADGEMRFKFFPLTAVVLNGGYGMVEHTGFQELDSTNWYAQAGVQGQITNALSLVLKGGWQMADYKEGEDFAGYLATGEMTAQFLGQTRLTFGYQHLYRDGTDTNYFTTHMGYLRFYRLWVSWLTTTLDGNYQYNDFSKPNNRHEDFIQGNFDITYRLVYWLYLGAGYQIEYLMRDNIAEPDTTTMRNTVLVHLEAKF
jgi:hypothetical protein